MAFPPAGFQSLLDRFRLITPRNSPGLDYRPHSHFELGRTLDKRSCRIDPMLCSVMDRQFLKTFMSTGFGDFLCRRRRIPWGRMAALPVIRLLLRLFRVFGSQFPRAGPAPSLPAGAALFFRGPPVGRFETCVNPSSPPARAAGPSTNYVPLPQSPSSRLPPEAQTVAPVFSFSGLGKTVER